MQATYVLSIAIPGMSASVQRSIIAVGDHPNPYEVVLPAAKPLTGWTQVDTDTASGTLPAGHGYTNGTFDVYWDGGERYDVPGTIAGDVLSLDGGTGDNFPATGNLTVRAFRQVTINTSIDGDNVQLGVLSLEYEDTESEECGRLLFEDAAGDDIASVELSANVPLAIGTGLTNPLVGDPITVCRASHSDPTNSSTIKVATLEDSTP
jgi:hypothetical protein